MASTGLERDVEQILELPDLRKHVPKAPEVIKAIKKHLIRIKERFYELKLDKEKDVVLALEHQGMGLMPRVISKRLASIDSRLKLQEINTKLNLKADYIKTLAGLALTAQYGRNAFTNNFFDIKELTEESRALFYRIGLGLQKEPSTYGLDPPTEKLTKFQKNNRISAHFNEILAKTRTRESRIIPFIINYVMNSLFERQVDETSSDSYREVESEPLLETKTEISEGLQRLYKRLDCLEDKLTTLEPNQAIVFEGLAKGLTTGEIGRKMNRDVSPIRKMLKKKLCAQNTQELVSLALAYAIREGVNLPYKPEELFSSREKITIYGMLGQGYADTDIAQRLGISAKSLDRCKSKMSVSLGMSFDFLRANTIWRSLVYPPKHVEIPKRKQDIEYVDKLALSAIPKFPDINPKRHVTLEGLAKGDKTAKNAAKWEALFGTINNQDLRIIATVWCLVKGIDLGFSQELHEFEDESANFFMMVGLGYRPNELKTHFRNHSALEKNLMQIAGKSGIESELQLRAAGLYFALSKDTKRYKAVQDNAIMDLYK